MKYLFALYQWLVAIPMLAVVTIIVALLTSIGSILFGGKWCGYYPPKIWAKCWCVLFFVKVEVINRELIDKNTSYVFVANHQGAFDIFSIYGYLNHNFKWMMKKSLENIPFVGMACRCVGHIMVDRSSAAAVKRTMDKAQETLREGMSLVVFPEGARSWNGQMRNFKKGAFKLAVEFGLPLVPITINGAFDVMPRYTYMIRPGRITLTIHKPIMPKPEGHNMENVVNECYNSIHSDLAKKYQ